MRMSEGAPKEKKHSAPPKDTGEQPTQDRKKMSASSSPSNQIPPTAVQPPLPQVTAEELLDNGIGEAVADLTETVEDLSQTKNNGRGDGEIVDVQPVVVNQPSEIKAPSETPESDDVSIKSSVTKASLPTDEEADAMLEKLDAMAAKLEAIAAAKAAAEPFVRPVADSDGEKNIVVPVVQPESRRGTELNLPAKLQALAAKLDALPARLDANAKAAQAAKLKAAPQITPLPAVSDLPSPIMQGGAVIQTQPAVEVIPPTTALSVSASAPAAAEAAPHPAPRSIAAKPVSAPPTIAKSPPPTKPSATARKPAPQATPSSATVKAILQPKQSATAAKIAPQMTPSDFAVKTPASQLAKPARSIAPAAAAAVSAYDPELADRAVKAKNLLTDQRFLRVSKTLMRFSLECCAEKVMTTKGETEVETRQRSAARLRQALVDLGPTFIKLGQFLSVRRDCLSVEMADELALLQDKVPPFPFDLVRKTIVSELGAPPEEIFQSFDEKPIASASIGQVHTAVLSDGRPVVVKVQRPDLARRFYQDLGCMRLLAKMGLLIKPDGPWQSWIELSDEFGRNLFQEINYLQEGRNADRVRTMLKDQPEIRIPRVYWKYTGRRVLTLEYMPGTKIDQVKELEAKGYDLGKIGNQLVSSYLEMVLMHGFFHADPHAGNLCVGPDGRIIIYDFGMMGEITDEQRDCITGCIGAVIKKDTEELVGHLKRLGIVKTDAQMAPIVRTVQPFIDYYAGKEVKDLDFTDLEHDIDQIAFDRALVLPPTLAYLLRAGTSLEGIARTLKPNFSFVEAAKPPLKRWLMSRPHQASSLVKIFINGNLAIGRDAILKLANGKSSETQTKSTKNDKPGKLSSAKPTASPATLPGANQEELTELRSRVVMLENQLKFQANQRYILGAMAVWMVFSTATAFLPQTVPYATYFLIGNGVMGAIIMWHLVTHLRPDKSPTKKGSSRGQRR